MAALAHEKALEEAKSLATERLREENNRYGRVRTIYVPCNLQTLTQSSQITETWVRTMIDEFNQGRILNAGSAVELIDRARRHFEAIPNVVELKLFEG